MKSDRKASPVSAKSFQELPFTMFSILKRYCANLYRRLIMSKRLLFMVLLVIATMLFVLVTRTQHYAGPTVRSDSKGGNKIVLLTYGRSGSTLTSEIINQDPSVFYTFEPLFNQMKRYVGKGSAFFHAIQDKVSFEKESVNIVEVFLTCSFESMNSADINNFQLHNSLDSRLLYNCIQNRRNWTLLKTVDCFIKARKTCLQRPVKMVKTIRLRGSAAKVLMERNPDLKLLYLFRDPRGTLTSQQRIFHNFKWSDVANFAEEFCRTFREDLSEIGRLIDRFPNRVKLLRYENLAENPFRVSQELYQFLGLNYTDRVRAFVFNRTMSGFSSGAYGTARKNSTLAAQYWRQTLTFEAARNIDMSCSDLYHTLGYLPAESLQKLKNLSRPLLKPAVFHGQAL